MDQTTRSKWMVVLGVAWLGACTFNSSPLGSSRTLEREAEGAAVESTKDPHDFGNAPNHLVGSAGTMAVNDEPVEQPERDAGAMPPVMEEPNADSGPDAGSSTTPPDAAAAEPDAAQDAAPPDEPPPAPGAPFSECVDNTGCEPGLICTSVLNVLNPTGMATNGYCTALCGSVDGTIASCLQPTSGNVKASCQLSTSLCTLEACERLECPSGLRCVDMQTPTGTGDVVHTYQCVP